MIEKSKSADLVQLIVQRRDLGCKKAQRVLLVDEEKVSAANLGNKIFWKLLGSNQTHTKAPEDAGPPEEDENYEIEVNILNLHSCQFIIPTSLFLDLKWQFSGGRE